MFSIDGNKLISSDFEMLRKLGWLIYDREDQDGGLTTDELEELLKIVTEDEMQRICQEAHNEGFEEGAGW